MAVIAVVLALGTALTFLSPVDRVALWLLFGLSMIVTAVRVDDGCEILAIPNTILRRTDAIWCPVYTPIDATEQPAPADGERSHHADSTKPCHAAPRRPDRHHHPCSRRSAPDRAGGQASGA